MGSIPLIFSGTSRNMIPMRKQMKVLWAHQDKSNGVATMRSSLHGTDLRCSLDHSEIR